MNKYLNVAIHPNPKGIGYSSQRGYKIKNKIKNNKQCVYCGCNNPLMLTVDHKVPVSRGGTNDLVNLQPCCWICNQLKGSLTVIEFKKYLKALKILHELVKLKIVFPQRLELKFSPAYYPDYDYKIEDEPIPIKKD